MDPTGLKRALSVAPERGVAGSDRKEQEFFCFKLGELSIGVPSGDVREVARCGPLTPLPRTASFVLGVCGHRGEVLPVVDLLRLLGKGEGKVGPRTRLFVGTVKDLTIAAVVDSVIGLRRIPVDQILPAPMGGDASNEHLLGVVTSRDGHEALNLLNFARLAQSARQRVVAR